MTDTAPERALHLVIVSGLSGSGKTQALKCLEDIGFFCVDNLPPALFLSFAEFCSQRSHTVRKIALCVDIREREFFSDFSENLERLQANVSVVELLYLEANDVVLIRRFSESRRPRPLLPRQYLGELRARADRVLDTSELTVHELRDWMVQQYGDHEHRHSMKIFVLTFGYKFGVPYEADLVFDVRFLQNPHFVPELKPLTGNEKNIQQYVLGNKEAQDFLEHMRNFLAFLLPLFERERRSYLTIAIGCTGGRHRSVAIANKVKELFGLLGYYVTLSHRDLDRSEY
ncbi:MAG: RNase adapter RapZ [Nitrospira sp.]|nr:RNase adapter RapZ [Nitrospira sp.]